METHLGIIEQFEVFELQTQIPKPPHISKFRDNQLFSPLSMPVSPFPRISRGFSLKIHLKKPAGFKKKYETNEGELIEPPKTVSAHDGDYHLIIHQLRCPQVCPDIASRPCGEWQVQSQQN